jgi:hypothetical protein
MSAWTVGDGGALYLHGVKIPGVKSVEIIPPGREAINDVGDDGQMVVRSGKIIPSELLIRVIDVMTDSKPELHPDIKDQVVDELITRILKLEDQNKRLVEALEFIAKESDIGTHEAIVPVPKSGFKVPNQPGYSEHGCFTVSWFIENVLKQINFSRPGGE